LTYASSAVSVLMSSQVSPSTSARNMGADLIRERGAPDAERAFVEKAQPPATGVSVAHKASEK